jgi:hypothetical protein
MCSLFVNDFAIYNRSQSLPAIEQQIQLTINWLSQWSQQKGFKFFVAKTTFIHFCQHKGVISHPSLFRDNSPLPFAETVGFLRLILDGCLT